MQASRTQEQDNKDILASQQEYRKGVSSWNFDVQALKAAAAAQGAEEDRLPPITEGKALGSRRGFGQECGSRGGGGRPAAAHCRG